MQQSRAGLATDPGQPLPDSAPGMHMERARGGQAAEHARGEAAGHGRSPRAFPGTATGEASLATGERARLGLRKTGSA